ncbi:MAG: hypothetical protein AB1486_26925, partial [Planctomycetota bacterium]
MVSSVAPAPAPAAHTAAASKAPVIAIRDGKVLLPGGRALERATVLIKNGKIEAIGAEVVVPQGAEVIDAAGKTVTAGLIDARSGLLAEGVGGTVPANASVTDAIDAYDQDALRWALERGVTAVYVSPGDGRPTAGVGAVIKLKPETPLEKMIVDDKAAVQFTLGTGETGRALSRVRERAGVLARLDAAKKYKEQWEQYEEDLAKYLEELKK